VNYLLKILLTLLAVPASFLPVAGQYKFINIGEERGLSSLIIKDLFQDSYDFVWVGTQNGLNRFDGYGCVTYINDPGDTASISSSYITLEAFVEDSDSNLWVASYLNGLNYFNRKTEKFTRYQMKAGDPNSLSMDNLLAIEQDGAGGLWIATMGRGFNHFNPENGRFKVWRTSEKQPELLNGASVVVSLMVDRNDLLWIGTNKGACRYDPKKNTFENFPFIPGSPQSLNGNFVTKILQDSRGNIWLGTDKGLNRWDERQRVFKKYQFAHAFPNKEAGYDYILDILEEDDGKMWLGTIGGLLLFNPADGSFEWFKHDLTDPFSILPGSVTAILNDRRGDIWFGTNNGISILQKSRGMLSHELFSSAQNSFKDYTQTEGILAVSEVGESFWLATQLGVYRYQPGSPVQAIANGSFSSLFYDAQTEQVYAGSIGFGLYVFDAQDFRLVTHIPKDEREGRQNPHLIKGHRINGIAKDHQGYIWMGVSGALNRYDPATGRLRQFYEDNKKTQNPSGNHYRGLMTDREGNLWMATLGGLSKLSKAELSKPFTDTVLHFENYFHRPGDRSSISSNVIFSLLATEDGKIWVGTEAGLNCFDPKSKTWSWYFKADGLAGDQVESLVEDRNGDIWVGSSQNGLSKFDKESGHFFRFSKKDGLNTGQFSPNAGICTREGFVVLGGRSGLAGFHPDSLVANEEMTAPLYFTDFQIFNKTVAIGEGRYPLKGPFYETRFIELDYDQKVISFQFTALNFISPEKQIYRYRLLPFHNEWQYNGPKREITFTNLDPGKYRLEVETSTNGYDWQGATLHLWVHPPWYRTGWAWLLYVAAFGGLLFGIRRYELRRQLAKAEARHFKELDTVKNQLYTNITHEFRTPLTVILGMAEQVKSDPKNWFNEGLKLISRNGRQLLGLVNQMLDLSKIESGQMPLHLVLGDVANYAHYLTESFQSLAESKDVRLHFVAGPKVLEMDYDPGKLQQVISNLLSNAIKFTPPGGDVFIEIKIEKQDTAVLSIRDTGHGIAAADLPHIFDRFYQVDASHTRHGEGTGIGLALVKELVKLMGGSIEVESLPGEGTTFTLRLPLTKTAVAAQPEILENIAQPLADEVILKDHTAAPGLPRSEQPVVLLIEDNQDVITYLASFLAGQYQIETAANGKTGIEKAVEIIPDLVVSDVMMPEKDGFEVCETLKTDERTCHIPVILLTAKSDHASKIEGLSHGADAYLAKPFSREELLVRIEKLIELRRQLQSRFKKLDKLVQEKQAQPIDPDEIFLKKLIGIVEEQLADEHFGVPELCKKARLSNSQLFRKLKALTGKPATRFIRSIRLEKAKWMLETTEMNVGEVGFATGFQDPAYFSRIFHKEFGMTPSDVRWTDNSL
jgi:signal transduction histidine kinase/DNA-binding response OmpR family regulator/streptogramin lyase